MTLLGAELRDEGIARAHRHISATHPATWAQANRWLLAKCLHSGQRFTSEDLIEYLEARQLITVDQDLRWLGSLFVAAVRADLVVNDGYVPSVRPSRHKGPTAVYQAGPGARHIDPVGDVNNTVAEVGRRIRRNRKASATAALSRAAFDIEYPRIPGVPAAPHGLGPGCGVEDGPSL